MTRGITPGSHQAGGMGDEVTNALIILLMVTAGTVSYTHLTLPTTPYV